MTVRRSKSSQPAFTLVELLVVICIVATLAALVFPLWKSICARSERSRMISLMRSVGMGINLYTTDHAATFPGPLWPGQVVEYSKIEDGRLVVRLAPYLDIEEKDTPYLVERFLTSPLRKALPSVPPVEIRMFVMNNAVPSGNTTINPWGTLTPGINAPLTTSAIAKPNTWALSEAYITHPAVTARPWKQYTAPTPLYGTNPVGLFFDGSVGFFNPSANP